MVSMKMVEINLKKKQQKKTAGCYKKKKIFSWIVLNCLNPPLNVLYSFISTHAPATDPVSFFTLHREPNLPTETKLELEGFRQKISSQSYLL